MDSAGLAVDEVVEPLKSPDDTECLTFNVTVPLSSLGEGFRGIAYRLSVLCTKAPNPFREASVSKTVSACGSKYLSTPSDETSFLTSVKARSCSGPQDYAVSFSARSLSGADSVARQIVD